MIFVSEFDYLIILVLSYSIIEYKILSGKRPNHLTTLVVEKGTLKTLKHMARKDESYDQLINSLINLRTLNQNETVNVKVEENSEGSRIPALTPSESSTVSINES